VADLDVLEVIAIAVIWTATCFDALRDAWMRSASWWKRHIVKWISFYLPLTYILFLDVRWKIWIPVMAISWIIWRCSLRYIGGVQWESMWTRWLRSIWKDGD